MPEMNYESRLSLLTNNYERTLTRLGDDYTRQISDIKASIIRERDPQRRQLLIDRASEYRNRALKQREKLDADFAGEKDQLFARYGQPEIEEFDPKKAYEEAYSLKQKAEEELKQFTELGPRAPGTLSVQQPGYVRALLPRSLERRVERYTDPGGAGTGVFIKELTNQKDSKGDPVVRYRPADMNEIRTWALRKAEVEAAEKRMNRISKNLHIRARDDGSAFTRGQDAGTFGDKINATKPRPTESSGQRVEKPTASELRALGTRDAYEQGKKLGYWE
jgi:hypothetical protein